jgi:hypothetical protein
MKETLNLELEPDPNRSFNSDLAKINAAGGISA